MRKGYIAGALMTIANLCFAAPSMAICSQPTPPLNNLAVEQFAEMAAINSFTYDFKALPKQLHALKPCYTKTGWHSFSLALQRADNINITKKNKLFVNAEKAGNVKTLTEQKDNVPWRVLVPIKVTYNNKTQTVTQNLDVKVLINIEDNKLGVEQITASPSLPVAETTTQKEVSSKKPSEGSENVKVSISPKTIIPAENKQINAS